MEKNLNRGQFLKELGLSSGALMAFYCLGGLTSCSTEEAPAPVAPTPPTSSKLDFTLDLSSTDFSKLKTEGQFVYKDSVLIANVKGGTFVALEKACTHQGTNLQYRLNNDDFWCSNHGSTFNSKGAVTKSPASSGLKVYSTELKDNKLRVFEA
jgi:cytochrome b6-f complex iron-sulfur subunit